MTDQARSAADHIAQEGAKAAETSKALNSRILDQAETNVREAFAALRAAASAGSMTEIMKVQTDYVRDQSERNMEQAKEIGEMIAGFGRSAMAGVGKTPGAASTD